LAKKKTHEARRSTIVISINNWKHVGGKWSNPWCDSVCDCRCFIFGESDLQKGDQLTSHLTFFIVSEMSGCDQNVIDAFRLREINARSDRRTITKLMEQSFLKNVRQ